PVIPFAAVSFSVPSVTIKNNQSASVNVTIVPPARTAASDHGIYGGYITISAEDADGAVYRVPYGGFIGDLQSIQVLNGTKTAGRQVGWINNNNTGAIAPAFLPIPTGYAFTMGEKPDLPSANFGHPTFTDVPNYLLHMDFQ